MKEERGVAEMMLMNIDVCYIGKRYYVQGMNALTDIKRGRLRRRQFWVIFKGCFFGCLIRASGCIWFKVHCHVGRWRWHSHRLWRTGSNWAGGCVGIGELSLKTRLNWSSWMLDELWMQEKRGSLWWETRPSMLTGNKNICWALMAESNNRAKRLFMAAGCHAIQVM